MATAAMSPPTKPARNPARMPRESTPQEIIATARSAPAGVRGVVVLSSLTALALWSAFTPLDFWPLAWIALAPLAALVRLERPTRWMYRVVYLGGLLFWIPTLQWMRLGDHSMYGAWIALSLYLALYFPLFVGLSRVALWRFGMPLTVAGPIIWVGLELLRGRLMTGFPWYFLGHSQHGWIELIQICDVVGVYGVSFVVALVACGIAELLPAPLLSRLRLFPAATMAVQKGAAPAEASGQGALTVSNAGRWWRIGLCLGVFAIVLGYGDARRSGGEFAPGPLVGLVQTNVTSSVKHDPAEFPKIEQALERLTGIAVKASPDLIVWPETMFRWPLLESPTDASDDELESAHPELPVSRIRALKVPEALAQLGQKAGASLVIGLDTISVNRESVRKYNSAAFVRSNGALAGRYDKVHRVIFGEYIPLSDTLPWLRRLTPFSDGFGIDAGIAPAVFTDDKGYRFAPLICYEDTIPELVRDYVNRTAEDTDNGKKCVDFLVNLTNDGWFHGSSELDQHLITAAFRCVECRTPMIRAVNTGISAIIDGDGVVRRRAIDPLTGNSKQVEAVIVDTVPLDTRTSLYLAGGDWFAGACLACCGFLFLMGLLGRFVRAPAAPHMA